MDHHDPEVTHLLARISSILEGACDIDQSMTKELRQFPVWPDPLFLSVSASYFIKDLQISGFMAAFPECYSSERIPRYRPRNHSNTPFIDIDQLLLNPIYRFFEGPQPISDGVTTVRLSTKSMVPGGRQTVAEEIVRACRKIRISGGGVIPTLRDIIKLLDQKLYRVIYQADINVRHPVLRSLAELLLDLQRTGKTLLDVWPTMGETIGYEAPFALLSLKTKLYLARQDWRTYFVCHDGLSHLIGATLTVILQGPDVGKRSALEYAKVVPAVDKNMLDQWLNVPLGAHIVSVKSDVSSFTASSVNGLLMLVAILISLTQRPGLDHLKVPFKIRVKTELISVTLPDLILAYLLLTLGRHFSLNGHRFPHLGYLGLPGNNIIAMIAFALRVLQLRHELQLRYPGLVIEFQLGGDDYWFCAAHVDLEVVKEVVGIVAESIRSYVGMEKDPVRSWYVADGDFTINDGLFCKKTITLHCELKSGGAILHFKTEESLPLPTQAFMPIPEKENTVAKFQAVMKSLLTTLARSGYDQYYPTYYVAVRENFEQVYVPDDRSATKWCCDPRDVRRVNHILLLPSAHRKVTQMYPLSAGGPAIYDPPFKVRLQLLSSARKIELKTLWINEEEYRVWVAQEDYRLIVRHRYDVMNYLPSRVGGTVHQEVVDAFRKLRLYVSK